MDGSKILIVEDELITAAHINGLLSDRGYQILEPVIKGEKVPEAVSKHSPDLIIMDINLAGKLNGIETAKIVSDISDIPIIFLTSNADDHTFSESKNSHPIAFLTKPFKEKELLRTIELALNRKKEIQNEVLKEFDLSNEAIFVTSKNKKVKIKISDIKYVKAERNYCSVVCENESYLLSMSLGMFEGKIPRLNFVRAHRSYLVNINAVDSLDDHYLFINKESIPIGNSYKKGIQKRLRII